MKWRKSPTSTQSQSLLRQSRVTRESWFLIRIISRETPSGIRFSVGVGRYISVMTRNGDTLRVPEIS